TSCSTVSCEASATTFGHVTTDAPRSVVGWAAARCEAAKAAKQTTAKRTKVRTTVPISLRQALNRLCQAELNGVRMESSLPSASSAAAGPTLRRGTDASIPRTVAFRDALRFWIKLGFISFGGPAGQITIMHRELVERRRWI